MGEWKVWMIQTKTKFLKNEWGNYFKKVVICVVTVAHTTLKDHVTKTSTIWHSDLWNVWHISQLTAPSFLLAFLIWTKWSRCQSPVLNLHLPFHYTFPYCTEIQDKLVMSNGKLYPGHCSWIHLLKKCEPAKKEYSFFWNTEVKRGMTAIFWSDH